MGKTFVTAIMAESLSVKLCSVVELCGFNLHRHRGVHLFSILNGIDGGSYVCFVYRMSVVHRIF